MIYESQGFKTYENFSILDQKQIQLMRQKNHKIILYDELIVDVSQFKHPGSQYTLFSADQKHIQQLFNKNNHSLYARMILSQMVVGRLNRHGKGQKLINQLKQSQQLKKHKMIIKKIDWQKPVKPQFNELSLDELNILVDIPIYIKNINKIKFQQKDWTISQYLYQNRFWVSTISFSVTLIILLTLLICYMTPELMSSSIICFIIGMGLWTIVQYYFHRFRLHYRFTPTHRNVRQHLIHHIFPNVKQKLSLLMFDIYSGMIGLQLVFSLLLGTVLALSIVVGFLFIVILYDCLHYWFHFGPQLWLIERLRREHLKHHFRDKNYGFGVTTVFWDYIFNTLVKK